MEPIDVKRERPEEKIQNAIIQMLEYKGWFVKRMGASAFLSGVPDLYCTHKVYGHRWVEVKLPDMIGSKFTPAQLSEFPKFVSNGSQIWVITGATEIEYKKLFQKGNLWKYLMAK